MESKICKNFSIENPITVENIIPIGGTLNFSTNFWQPFIDTESGNICGPLLGIAVEISRKLKVSLWCELSKHEEREDLELLKNNQINIFLYPLVATNLTDIFDFVELSHSIGEVTMISILSSKGNPINSSFQMMKAFTAPVWISIIICYILTACITARISHSDKPFMRYLAIFFRQQLSNFECNESTSMISLIWLMGSSIITWALSGAILSFLVFTTPHEKIDSMADLANKQINFTVLKGENSHEFVTDPNEKYTQLFVNKFKVEDPPPHNKTDWENDILTKISTNNYALVSDQAFLDYYIATKLIKFPNLHRSEQNLLTLPYFIPISKHNSQFFIKTIKFTICALFESGIYNSWIRDTLEQNNIAVRKGLVVLKEIKYKSDPILLQQYEGLFYILIAGVCISFIFMIIECILFKIKECKI